MPSPFVFLLVSGQIDSIQPQIPIVSGVSSDQIPISAVQIPNSAAAVAATPGERPAIVTDNVICNDVNDSENISEFTGESSNEVNIERSNKVISGNVEENTSVSINKVISSDVKECTSESINSPLMGTNLVSPGSSLDSASLGGLEGGAQAPRSSNSAARVSGVPASPKIPKAAASGVQKPSTVHHAGLRPGLCKVVEEWAQIARGRKR